ncbi:MAG: CAP domain-containing protein [Candidatus Yonathbacteria bacterium]|nr:CAP domain-containing protein [Candidatus Yonathbacteria bacterium]
MFGQLLMILAGIFALISAGAFSYTYLEQTMGPRESTQPTTVVEKKSVAVAAKPLSTQTVTKVSAKATAPTKTNGSLVPAKVVTEKTVVAPGPLRAIAPANTTTAPVTQSSALTVRGVIEYTNGARSLNGGLPALIENETLDRDAKLKLDDMFAKQYFEHVSLSGVNIEDLAKTVGYTYLRLGENLALGDFKSDQHLVDAWMNSPGHRANILNTHYQEIGVAVGKGMYEGRETWLAVQSFGTPLSACPAISATLKVQIDTNNTTIASLRAQLDAKKVQLDATLQSDPNYNVYVGEFNALVPEYNTLVESNRVLVATYNATVQSFNDCINSAGTLIAR